MSFSRSDLERLARLVGAAAEREIMPRYRVLAETAVREKTSALDLVTDADEAVEAMLQEEMAKHFPGAAFVGEESVERDRTLLKSIATADLAVIVDPVDGTNNFAWGLPLFGVLAAVTVKGETVAGLIYDPIGKDFTFALRGYGAWMQRSDGSTRTLQVSRTTSLEKLTGVTSWYHMPEPLRSRVTANLARVRAAFSYRCAAYEYRLIAQGHIDFSMHNKLMPWDHAAGVLIHKEAGGYSALFDGRPYRPTLHEGGILLAPNAEAWHRLHDAVLAAPL